MSYEGKDGFVRDVLKVREGWEWLRESPHMKPHWERLRGAGIKDWGHAFTNILVEGARKDAYTVVHTLLWTAAASISVNVGILVASLVG